MRILYELSSTGEKFIGGGGLLTAYGGALFGNTEIALIGVVATVGALAAFSARATVTLVQVSENRIAWFEAMGTSKERIKQIVEGDD